MHITILSAGSRGDVQPFIVLGQTLQARGHRIRLAAPQNFTALIGSHHLETFPMRVDFQQMLKGQAGQQMMASGKNVLQAGEISQAQIARELGVTEAAVSRWKKKLDRGGPPALQAHTDQLW